MTCSFTPSGGGSRVVSLWDMLRFYADQFVEVCNYLNRVEALMAQPQSLLQIGGLLNFYAGELDKLRDHLKEMNLPISAKQARRLHTVLTSFNDNSPDAVGQVIKQYSEELTERIADELEGRTFFCVSDHVGLLSNPLPFGESVDEAFPSARYDISEAGHCLAFRRPTACVMHLMRALEVSLASLATGLGLILTTKNWHTILDGIAKEIKSRNKHTHGQQWEEENESFFAEAATHFLMIKNAWRNHAMHGKDKYTDEEAEKIYDSVKSFMRHLSERLSEGNVTLAVPNPGES